VRIYDDSTVAVRWRVALAEHLRISPPQDSKTTETGFASPINLFQSP